MKSVVLLFTALLFTVLLLTSCGRGGRDWRGEVEEAKAELNQIIAEVNARLDGYPEDVRTGVKNHIFWSGQRPPGRISPSIRVDLRQGVAVYARVHGSGVLSRINNIATLQDSSLARLLDLLKTAIDEVSLDMLERHIANEVANEARRIARRAEEEEQRAIREAERIAREEAREAARIARFDAMVLAAEAIYDFAHAFRYYQALERRNVLPEVVEAFRGLDGGINFAVSHVFAATDEDIYDMSAVMPLRNENIIFMFGFAPYGLTGGLLMTNENVVSFYVQISNFSFAD